MCREGETSLIVVRKPEGIVRNVMRYLETIAATKCHATITVHRPVVQFHANRGRVVCLNVITKFFEFYR